MSRCFPFPPPGYDIKKDGPDDVNLLKKEKEKHKQKKNKDKKDKDKKERSDRKEKERSEGKEKERSEGKDRDRKEKKHKEKKDKKKDKHKSSEEKGIVEGGSLDNNQNGDKILAELGKRVRNDDEATENRMVQKMVNNLVEQRTVNNLVEPRLVNNLVEPRMVNNLVEPRTVNNLVEQRTVNLQGRVEEKSDRVLPNGHHLEFGAKGLENGFVGKFSRENQNSVGASSSASEVPKVEKKKKEEKEKKKDSKKSDGKGDDGRKNEDRDKNKKAEEKKRKKEKKKEEKEKKKERSKEETKQRRSGDNSLDCCESSDLPKDRRDSKGNLPKEPQSNGFFHDNEIRPDNMSRPALSSLQVGQNGSGFYSSQNIINSSVEKVPVIKNHKGIHSSPKIMDPSVEKGPPIFNHKTSSGILSSPQSVIKNAKNTETGKTANNSTMNNHVIRNGIISSSDVAMSEHVAVKRKADNNFPSSHPLSENGKEKMELKIDKGANSQGSGFNRKMEQKEGKINGVVLEGKKHSSSKPSSASVKAKEKLVETSVKPPHPDSKYLSEILDIPKVEWPQFDDEEWLFGCKDSKRPKLAPSSEIEWPKPVWAEAMRLESEDITALPYVIPY